MKLAVIGDVHGLFDDKDVAYLNASDYAGVLFVGDLGNYRDGGDLTVARSIARLTKPTWVIPGNHDAVHLAQLLAEVVRRPNAARLWARRQGRRVAALSDALGPAKLVGYDRFAIEAEGETLDVIVGRPHAMDGGQLSFSYYLSERFGISTLEQSAQRLKTLVDQSTAKRLLFLAHNGPAGLGAARHDIWGCDFLPGAGDWGDVDLRDAIDHARAHDKQVLAVVAGHMHHKLRGGGNRTWTVQRDGTLYVNAARVPRIQRRDGIRHHHHLALHVTDKASVTEHWIAAT
jgi:uncharacterized protein (TIGR04168 family)